MSTSDHRQNLNDGKAIGHRPAPNAPDVRSELLVRLQALAPQHEGAP
jgi:hypothetical protein